MSSYNVSGKSLTLSRGREAEGEVVDIGDKEIILDFGTKSEGIIPTRELSTDQLKNLKLGDKLKAYVVMTENEYGQVLLSLHYSAVRPSKSRGIDWARFTTLQNQKSKLQGKVIEINKGGLMIEVDSTRGFLPNSQAGFELLSKSGDMGELIGQSLTVTVIEVDQNNNKLIFSQRGQVSDQVLEALKGFKKGQKVSGKIVAILPFGLVVDLDGMEGLVFISDVSWEKVLDLTSLYTLGQIIEAKVLGVDEDFGRVNLSIRHLSEDPFTKLSQKYPADEVVKGQIVEVTTAGVVAKLEDPSGELGRNEVEGFLPASKMDPKTIYEVGKVESFLVDGVDVQKRRINLASFVTTTKGLIYK